MNPYLVIAALLAVLGAGAAGFKLGADHEQASQAREDQQVAKAVDAANATAAAAIAKLRPKYTTIQAKVQNEVQKVPVYLSSGCDHSDNGLRLVNEALSGYAKPVGGLKLPRLDAFGGTFLRGDDGKAD